MSKRLLRPLRFLYLFGTHKVVCLDCKEIFGSKQKYYEVLIVYIIYLLSLFSVHFDFILILFILFI